MWELRTKPVNPCYTASSSRGNVMVCFSPDDLYLLVSAVDNEVKILFMIFPLNQRIIKSTGFVAKTAWAGAAYTLLLYMLASHVLGASWYLMSIGRQHSCWQQGCKEETASKVCISFLDCNSVNQPERKKSTSLRSLCDASNETSTFKFGMLADAFTSEVASSKYLYCLWWGLINLSYSQNIHNLLVCYNSFCDANIIICFPSLYGQNLETVHTVHMDRISGNLKQIPYGYSSHTKIIYLSYVRME